MNNFIPWMVHYPYQNLEMMNLNWLIAEIEKNSEKLSNFVNLNTIKYADPIQWNITTQYEINTVVIEPISGTAYISTQPVPSGVGINNTDYWTVIFTLDVISANKNITLRDDGNNVLATFESQVNDWLLWEGTLYIVTRDIDIGNAYVDEYNIERKTVEDFLKGYITLLAEAIGDLNDLSTTDKTSIVNAINEVASSIGDLTDLDTADKTKVVAAINEIYGIFSASTVLSNISMKSSGHNYINDDLVVGSTNKNKDESLVGGSSGFGTVDGLSPNGKIGIFGSSHTKDNPSAGYPIGVMGLAVADSDASTSTVGAGYFHLIRKSTTSGASVGLEVDADVEITSQDITPNTVPNPSQNFSCGLAISSGGGDHTGGNSQPLSTAIQINKNPAQFRHALNVGRDVITEEAICLPSNSGGLLAWWSDPNQTPQSRPMSEIQGLDLSSFGGIQLRLWNPNTASFVEKIIDINSQFEAPKIKIITKSGINIAAGNSTINLSSDIDTGYKLHGAYNLQPSNTAVQLTITNIDPDNSNIGIYAAAAVTTSLFIIISEVKA